MSNNSSKAGIVNIGNDRIIPASRRPDGSVRKEIKVRQGYTPPEDVQKYQSKAQLNQSKAHGYIAGLGVMNSQEEKTKTQIKNQKRKQKKNDFDSLYLIMHGLLEEMKLDDLKHILESFDDLQIEKLTFSQEKEAAILRILKGFNSDSKGIGERIFSIAKLTELRRLCGKLNIQDSGDRNEILENINNCLKDRFKDVYKLDLTRPFDDFDSVPSVPLGEPKNHIVAELVEIADSREAYEKKLKGLKKKLRQIELIQDKDVSTLLPEQVEKLKSKDAVVQEIHNIQESLSGLSLKN